MSEASIPFPTELRDRFVPRRVLGQGGMGIVVLAQEVATGRDVVVKRSLGPLDASATRRALREGRMLVGLQHPNIVQVFEVGEGQDGPYLVMEYLEGETLSEGGGDPLAALEPMVSALEAVHAAGLVHRDIKPENIIRCRDGRIVLVDFGLALTAEHTRLTATGNMVGTLAFMAPEVLRGETAGPAADWYGWGASLYWLYVGRPPLTSEALVAYATGGEAPGCDLAACPAGAPRDLLARVLEVDPTRRMGGAELRDWYRGGAEASPPLSSGSETMRGRPLTLETRVSPAPVVAAPARMPPWAVLGVIGLGLVAGWGTFDTEAEPPPAAPKASAIELPALEPMRVRLDRALERLAEVSHLEEASGLRSHDSKTMRPILVGAYPDFLSQDLPRVWRETLDASLDWIEAVEKRGIESEHIAVERYIFEQVLPRTKWFRAVYKAFERRQKFGVYKSDVFQLVDETDRRVGLEPDWDEVALGDRLVALREDFSEWACGRVFAPAEELSPVRARALWMLGLGVNFFKSENPRCEGLGLVSRQIVASQRKALREKFGNPAAWRHDIAWILVALVDQPDFPLPLQLELVEELRTTLDEAPNPSERSYWLVCLARTAVRISHCRGGLKAAEGVAESLFEELRKTTPADRIYDHAGELKAACLDSRCAPTDWSRDFFTKVDAWK